MSDISRSHYINGFWTEPTIPNFLEVINPANEEVFARIALGGVLDVDLAVTAARRAFNTFSKTSVAWRIELLKRIWEEYERHSEEMAQALTAEMGAPINYARHIQVGIGTVHLSAMIETLRSFEFEQRRKNVAIVREPIGVVGLITPWNWPMNQIICKVAPAIAAGCTIVLKPSELAPLSAMVFGKIMERAEVPAGVFNLIQGDGSLVGQALSAHADVDFISFTGSTDAGISVAKSAANTVKRVAQELGGKSANILLPDADFDTAVKSGVRRCFSNSGQSCDAPSRMLVPESEYEKVAVLARQCVEELKIGNPMDAKNHLGPLANRKQYTKVQSFILKGISDGAELIAGGEGKPTGLTHGFYVRPTVFGRVSRTMSIAKEEIFGPVLSILTYESIEEAIDLANDTVFGLSAYIQTRSDIAAQRIARELRVGSVYINEPEWDARSPFGGYKRSGNGREYAEFGLSEYLELKAICGANLNRIDREI